MVWLVGIRTPALRFVPVLIGTPSYNIEASFEFRNKCGFMPNGINAEGNAVPNEFWPQAARFKHKVKFVPPLLGVNSFYLFPEPWVELFERFEPGLHDFRRIPITFKDGSPLKLPYYAANIRCGLRDVADWEKSVAPRKCYGSDKIPTFVATSESELHRIYFKREAVAGHHLWQPNDTINFRIAMSDELFEAFGEVQDVKLLNTLYVEEV